LAQSRGVLVGVPQPSQAAPALELPAVVRIGDLADPSCFVHALAIARPPCLAKRFQGERTAHMIAFSSRSIIRCVLFCQWQMAQGS
jgi:hypothetical protein